MAVKTLLDVVKEVCYRINEPAPSSLVASTRASDLQWLHLLYEVGETIYSQFDYPTLKKKWQFSTVASQKYYELPGEYWRLTLNTQWDESNNWAMFGPEDDSGIVTRDLGIVPYGTQYSFRIIGAQHQEGYGEDSWDEGGPQFEVSPLPGDVRNLYIEYISSNWFHPAQFNASTAYSLNDYFSSRGNIYKVTSAGTSGTTYPDDESGTSGTMDYQLWRGNYNVPSADTDFPIIDSQALYLGLRAARLRAKGLDYQAFEQQFIDRVAEISNRFQGQQQVSGDGPVLYDFPNVSDDFLVSGF